MAITRRQVCIHARPWRSSVTRTDRVTIRAWDKRRVSLSPVAWKHSKTTTAPWTRSLRDNHRTFVCSSVLLLEGNLRKFLWTFSVPVSGTIAGGQNLTITGTNFDIRFVVVKLGTSDCLVDKIHSTDTSIYCTTPQASSKFLWWTEIHVFTIRDREECTWNRTYQQRFTLRTDFPTDLFSLFQLITEPQSERTLNFRLITDYVELSYVSTSVNSGLV